MGPMNESTIVSNMEQEWKEVSQKCEILHEALKGLEAFEQRIISLEKSSRHSTLGIQEDVRLKFLDINIKEGFEQERSIPLTSSQLCCQDSSRSPRLNKSMDSTLLAMPLTGLNLLRLNSQSGSYGGRGGNEDNAYGYSAWGGIAWDDKEREKSTRETQNLFESFHRWLESPPNDVSDYFKLKITTDTQQIWIGLKTPPRYLKSPKKYRCAVMRLYNSDIPNYPELRYTLPPILKHQLSSIWLIGKMLLVIYVYCTVVDVERVLGNHMP